MKKLLFNIFLLTIMSIGLTAFCADVYVDAVNGDDGNSGTEENDAWKTLTYAIDAIQIYSSPTTVYVAPGLYDLNNGESFPINLRGHTAYIGQDPETTIIDGTDSPNTVLYISGQKDLVLEGFTITGGSGVSSIMDTTFGGGIYCTNSSPIIRNCIIEDNERTTYGGGIYYAKSGGELDNCILRGNEALVGGGIICIYDADPYITNTEISGNIAVKVNENSGIGGGIHCEEGSIPHLAVCVVKDNDADYLGGGISCIDASISITDSEIENNSAVYGGGIFNLDNSSPIIGSSKINMNNAVKLGEEGGAGGGIYNEFKCNPTIYDCEIVGNQAEWFGGGLVNLNMSNPFVINSKFIANISPVGGGMYNNMSSPNVDGCTFLQNAAQFTSGDTGHGGAIVGENETTLRLSNSEFFENNADNYGGSILLLWSTSSVIVNCLFAENTTAESDIYVTHQSNLDFSSSTMVASDEYHGPAISATDRSSATLVNSIVRGFGNPSVYKAADGSSANATFCNIENGFVGEGNIDSNPHFTSGPRGDFYLSSTAAGQIEDSPCIDAGSDTVINIGLQNLTTRQDGVFDKSIIDMGYHYQPNVNFSIWHGPGNEEYNPQDEVTIFVDVHTAPANVTADLYFVMLSPAGNIYSGFAWNQGVSPLIAGITLPASTAVNSIPLFSFSIPNTNPPVGAGGTYYFGIVAAKQGSLDFISELMITSFLIR